MTGLQILGAAMIAAVLLGVFVMITAAAGWRIALAIFGLSFLATMIIGIGASLLSGTIR